jgi:hypothetical protein
METEPSEETEQPYFIKEVEYCDLCDGDIRTATYFLYDSRSADWICSTCGNASQSAPNLRSVKWYELDMEKPSQTQVDKVRARGSTYNRRAHINERLSSANAVDPIIPKENFSRIVEETTALRRSNWFFNRKFETGRLDKRDIQTILRSIDKKIAKEAITENDVKLTKRAYCVQYLEKWKSIVADLLGKDPVKYTYAETGTVGAYFQLISNAWDSMQPPHDKSERKSWKFKERRHCPNFNFIFQRIHTLIGPEMCKKYNKEFPIPKNPHAVARLWTWWTAIAKYLNLPVDEKDCGQGFTHRPKKTFKQLNLLETWKNKQPPPEKDLPK